MFSRAREHNLHPRWSHRDLEPWPGRPQSLLGACPPSRPLGQHSLGLKASLGGSHRGQQTFLPVSALELGVSSMLLNRVSDPVPSSSGCPGGQVRPSLLCHPREWTPGGHRFDCRVVHLPFSELSDADTGNTSGPLCLRDNIRDLSLSPCHAPHCPECWAGVVPLRPQSRAWSQGSRHNLTGQAISRSPGEGLPRPRDTAGEWRR